jgi:diguanylate cyclase (GGDEF)-like protein
MATRDGSLIWVHELAELQSDGITLIGTVRDITEQKNLELKLEQQAVIDPLTQIGNRRAFNKAMDREFNRYSRYKKPLSLISFDLDHFKRVNDTYGHAAGDKVLSEVAATVKSELREEDIFARVGGEEFAVLLPETDENEALTVAEKIRDLIEGLEVHYESHAISLTATVGLVSVSEQVVDQEHLLQIADRALYKGKTNGRNQVVLADESLSESSGE